MDLFNLLNIDEIDFLQYKLPLITAVGAWGGFPNPPRVVQRLFAHKIVQYAMVFMLVYQGGSNQDLMVSAIVTAVIFVITKGLNMLDKYLD